MAKPVNGQNLERLACCRDFVGTVIPGITRTDSRILEISGREDLYALLKKEFPDTEVEQLKPKNLFPEDSVIKPVEMEPFDYIAAVGLKYVRCDSSQLFRQLLDLLKPEGVISAVVLGFFGYYGLAILGSIIQKLCGGRDIKETISFVETVLTQLPPLHPVFEHEIFMERLKARDEKAFEEILTISEDKIYTVSRLMEAIPQWGGKFKGWVFPELYHPSRNMKMDNFGREIIQHLSALSEPRRSITTELVNASPPEHYFYFSSNGPLI